MEQPGKYARVKQESVEMEHVHSIKVKKEPIDMEHGQCSRVKEEQQQQEEEGRKVWAKLVPKDSRYAEIEMRAEETATFSETACSSGLKQNWCVITRIRGSVQSSAVAIIRNTSSGALLVDGSVVEIGEDLPIKCGSIIVAGPSPKEYLHYIFEVLQEAETDRRRLMITLDIDHTKCSICLNIWHDVVTVAPCLHNFCNGCFSEWLKRSQKNRQPVLCPQCRATVLSAGRNHFLHNIEEEIIHIFPLLKRSEEEFALLNKSAVVQTNFVLGTRSSQSRKRPAPSSRDNASEIDPCCHQCAEQLGGFKCNQTTIHLQCHACGGMMPFRPDLGVPQNCLGCNRAFCGAYWQTQGINSGDMYLTCSRESFKPISQHTVSTIPETAHNSNRYEQSITEKCMQQSAKSLQSVISEWMVKFSNREIDRSRLPLSHAELISAESHLCNDCYYKLVGYLLYWFRISLPKYLLLQLLPPEAANREDCWYGYACRTQHHNPEHAEKRNHVCRPTRGNPNPPLTS